MNMAVKLTIALSLFSVLCVFPMTAEALNCEVVKRLANFVGGNLTTFFKNVTRFDVLKTRYDLSEAQLSVKAKDGPSIANKMKTHLEGILEKKIKSIKHLAAMTEELRENYTYDPNLRDTKYYNSKNLEGLELKKDLTFSQEIEINSSSSIVHVPTDVYSGGVKIVNTIKWTAGLEKYFLKNKKDEPSLLWQYFGSADGVYRVHPAFKWPVPSDQDMFDNRRRGWYIQGSSSPKDVVIVMDLSGSLLGSKLAIAKLAAMSLLDTLQENDFVHVVVVYESIPGLVCQVSKNGSAVLPLDKVPDCLPILMLATEQNKKFLMHSIPNVKASGIAAASKGIDTAIKVLKESRSKYKYSSSNCTQAIILFTDGIEDNDAEKTKNILQENNSDKKIRLFTYLVGREKGVNDKPLKEMSADYRGCLFKIETLSDVREKVHLYMSVLSRALGFSEHRTDASWTPIYLDRLGLGLMITIVAPVFNTTGKYKGGLLGVVGTDVALPELEDSVPGGEVGVNGYGFAINNNGFVLFHPSLKKEKDPPNISFNEVEYNRNDSKRLMRQMIDRKTGEEIFENRLISNDTKRASFLEEYHYFYSPIANTSFSAAVAIPKHGLNALYVDERVSSDLGIDDLKPVNGEEVIIAPWKICPQVNIAAKSQTPVYQPSYPTAEDIRNDPEYSSHCDEVKVRHLLFDEKETREIAREWKVEENDTRGVQSVFVGTQGGIMRLLNPGIKSNSFQRDYVKEQFYWQAAQYARNGEEIVVFSAPYRDPDYRNENNESSPQVTASSAIVFSKGGNQTIAAVVGMQIDGDSLRDLFLNSTAGVMDDCKEFEGDCKESETCSLRLIDNDGFVVASNDKEKSEVGKFVGAIEGAVMRDFINRTFFQRLTFIDVQGQCKKREEGTSSARTLLNPLFTVTSYVQFWTQTIFWSLTQFNFYSFLSGSNLATAEENESEDGQEIFPCNNELKFYKADEQTSPVKPPHCEGFSCLEDRNTYVALADVPNTNLKLLVVKNTCACDENSQLTTKPTEDVSGNLKATFNQYRIPPIVQTPCNDLVQQDKPPCALGSLPSPHWLFTVLMAILGSCHVHNLLWR